MVRNPPTTVYLPVELREFVDAMRNVKHRSVSTQIVLMLLDWQDQWFEKHSTDEYERILEDKETDEIELEIMKERIKQRKPS